MGRERKGLLDLGGTDAVLRAVLSACLGQYRRNEAQLLAALDGETLHQARASLRRLRSALRLFQPLTGPLHDKLSAARDEAFAHALAALHAASTRAVLLDLSEWVVLHPPLPADDARDYAARQLDCYRRKVKKAGQALVDGDDAARHRLRKHVKRLRHAVELFGSLFPASGRRARYMAALLPLQDALGALNDLVVAQAVLARIRSSRVRGAAALIGQTQRPALLATAVKAHEQVMTAPRFWR